MITLFGATGFTGRLIARALDRAGLSYRLAGRSPDKLAAVSASLTSHPPTLAADVSQAASLPALFAGTRLLINCAGPFTDLGEPVVALAAAHGVHYLDITNELAYVLRLQQYDALARRTGAAIVPACGFEVALVDCAAALLARGLIRVDEMDVTYALHGSGMSLGTRLSGLRIFATGWLAFRDGKLVGQRPGASVRRTVINNRDVAGLAFPSSELATLPQHVPVQNLRVWLAIARRTAGLAPVFVPVASALLRTPLAWLMAQVIKRIMPPPSESVRRQDRFGVKLELRAGTTAREQTWLGPDPYWLTGEIAAFAAQVMVAPGYNHSGVLAPSQALGAESFIQWLRSVPEVREAATGG